MVAGAVAVHVKAQEAAVVGVGRGRQHHGAASVAEEDARPSVPPVDVPGEDVGSDDQYVFVLAPADKVDSVDDADDEAAAGGGEIHGQGTFRADRGLHGTRGSE